MCPPISGTRLDAGSEPEVDAVSPAAKEAPRRQRLTQRNGDWDGMEDPAGRRAESRTARRGGQDDNPCLPIRGEAADRNRGGNTNPRANGGHPSRARAPPPHSFDEQPRAVGSNPEGEERYLGTKRLLKPETGISTSI